MDDDKQARDRLLIATAARLTGLAIFFMGIAVIYTDWVRRGGWPQVGAIIVILGVIDAAFAPLLLKRLWAQQDQADR